MHVTRLGACVVGQLSKKMRQAKLTVEIVGIAQRLTHLSARTQLVGLRAELKTFGAAVIMTVSACTAWQTQESTLDQISTINNMRYSQLLTNLSDAIDQRDSIPSSGVPSSGTATIVASGGLAFTLTQPFSFAHNTKTFTPSATLNWQNNWTITPVSDPQDLQNLRALAGLLYYSDQDIWDFIHDTLRVWNIDPNTRTYREDPKSKNIANIPKEKLTTAWEDCGISPNRGEISDPMRAMEAYFETWNAFPDYYSQVTLNVSFPTPKSRPAEVTIPAFGAAASPPFITINPHASVTVKALQALLSSETHPPCFGTKLLGGEITNAGLAASYGLLYPNKDQVTDWMRNGVLPACREYQINNIDKDRPKNKGPGQTLLGHFFERWLFWNDAIRPPPYPPPAGYALEYLGKYGTHDFWTTSGACLADFVVLTINATANSHAAAQNAPKPTGPTSAVPGS